MNRVIQGDCRDAMRQLLAEGVRVQCVVTSPPYWGLRDYGIDGQLGLEPHFKQYVESMVEVFDLVRELLADDGTCWLNLGDSYSRAQESNVPQTKYKANSYPQHAKEGSSDGAVGRGDRPGRRIATLAPKQLIGIPWRVALALQDAGWWLRQDIIWSKPNPMPESVTDRCTKAHEYLFLLTKSERYYYDAEAIKESADLANWRDSPCARRDVPPGQSTDTGFLQGRKYELRNKRSVWHIATQPYPDAHFATMPEELVKPCVIAGSKPGDIVFDPFMGSGTVARVAQRLGRDWLGAELNPDYVKLIEQRTRGAVGMF